MNGAGFPDPGFPIAELAICTGCEWAFRACDAQCPRCAGSVGWMLLPRKFFVEESPNDKAGAGTPAIREEETE